MEKNYNYNFENRLKAKKTTVISGNLTVFSCSAIELKKRPVSNGKFWHTTDTNEFYYDWDGKRTKLNITGDIDSVNAEIAKIKSDIAKLDPDAVQQKVDILEGKVNAAVSTINNLKIQVNSAVSSANSASQIAQAAASQVANKVDANYVDNVVAGKVDKSDLDGYATESWVEEKGFLTEHQDISGKANVSDLKTVATSGDYNDLENKPDLTGFATTSALDTLKIKVDGIQGLSAEDKAKIDSIPSDLSTGLFPESSSVDSPTATSNGFATVQDVMDYVNALIEKKKDELGPVEPGISYLYTNGYRVGDTAIGLTDTLNRYEIVLNENNEFEIELLHKNEEDGYYDTEDPTGSYYGTYFKVIVPNGYSVNTYLWDESSNPPAYKSDDTSVTDPAYSLIAEDVTPDNTTYYYKDAVEGFLFSGAKQAIEDDIQQNYSGHLIKLVLKK